MEILTLTYLRELLPSAMTPRLHSESLQCSNELFHLAFICSDFDLSSQLTCSVFLLSDGSAGVKATLTVILLWAFCPCVSLGKRPQVGSGGPCLLPVALLLAPQPLPTRGSQTRSSSPGHFAQDQVLTGQRPSLTTPATSVLSRQRLEFLLICYYSFIEKDETF